MTEYQDYLDFMYSLLDGHNKDNLVLSETTELVADIGLSSLEVMAITWILAQLSCPFKLNYMSIKTCFRLMSKVF